MTLIEEFPSDDAYRVVKWIDKFILPHLATRSASVTVRLQRLPFRSHSELNRLTRLQAVALLPLDRTDPRQDQYTSVPLHAGLLPHLAIGRIYQGQRLVGELPATLSSMILPDAEQSCREIRIGDALEAPANWSYPYRLIHSAEYGGIQSEFSASRCLVFIDAKGVEYVLPRAVIFRTFYALQRELANAFTSGPWITTKRKIVYEGALQSGLKTQIEPTSGEWHVILQTHVDNDFARLAALLYFDEYATACAESLYSGMLSDRRGDTQSPWFASAKIPFRAESKPLRLEVKGFLLSPRLGRKDSDGKRRIHKQTFLVTSILGSSWPSYTPPIKFGRLNSSDKGREQLPAEGDRPYAGHPRGRPAGSDLVTTSSVDALATQGGAITLEDRFSWLDVPEPQKLTKDTSQFYESNIHPPQAPPPTTASGGDRTHQTGNAPPAHHRVLIRDPVNRFRYLLGAFDALLGDGDVRRYSILQPVVSSQMTQCGGLICWNFLDEEARRTGLWPFAGWRMLERARGNGPERSIGTPRCVLVVRVEFGCHTGYWFEIETRSSEGGILSPFIADLKADEQVVSQHIVESIARADGRNLRQVMAASAQETGSGIAHCYKHSYKGDLNSELDPNSLRRFLAKFVG